MRRTVYVILILLLLIPVSGLIYIASTTHGLRWVLSVAGDALPGKLSIETTSGRLIGPLRLSNVMYIDDEQTVAVDSLSMDWNPLRLLFSRFHVNDLNTFGVRVEIKESSTPVRQREGLPAIRLPIDILVDTMLVKNISIYQADASPPFTIKKIMLKGGINKETVHIENLNVLSETFDVFLQGTIKTQGDYPLSIQTDWKIRPEGYAQITGAGNFSGTVNALKIKQGIKTPCSVRFDANVYDVMKKLQWDATFTSDNLALENINSTWPKIGLKLQAHSAGTISSFNIDGTADLSEKKYGTISSAFSISKNPDMWLIKNLHLSIPGSKTTADVTGRYSQVNDEAFFESQVKWNFLSWPLTGNDPDVISRTGTLAIQGGIDDYGFSLAADITGKQIPQSHVKLKGTGSTVGITVSSLYAKLLDGELTGIGAVKWKPSLDWQASLQATSVNPGAHWQNWPGKLNIKTAAKGGMKNDILSMSFKSASVEGKLRGHPFSADALLDMTNNTYKLHHFEMRSGSAHLSASGSYSNAWNAKWAASIPALGELYPGANGELYGQGQIKGDIKLPKIMAGVQGSGLSFESYQAAGVSINIDVDTTDSANSIIDVSAEGVLINAQEIKKFMLKAEGKLSSHMLQVSAGTKKESIRLSADAGYTDDVWHGNFTSSELDLADYGLWIFKGKGAFSLSSKTAHTDNLCWINDSASVCIQTAWNDKNGLTGNTRLSNIPLTLFRQLIPAKINVEGVIEGDGNISFNNNHLYGHTAFAITEGSISYTSKKDGPVTILLEQATLETILNENALDVKTDVSLKERGHIKVGINLPHFTPMDINKEKQAISGRIASELDMLDLIPRFTNTIENTKGIVLSDLGISGTLARPDVTGYMKLQGGQADILDLGIHLKDIRIDVAANKNRTLHLDGQCSSGSGDIMLQGEIHAAGPDKMNHDKMNSDKVNAELHIKGDNFETVKVPGLWLVASPDINIRLQDTIIAVDGKLSIPKALIEPPDLSKMVPVSKDVFIISGEPEEDPEETWKLSSRIKLALGDDVRFKGYGLTCRIAGSIGITDEPGRATSSEGELRILDGQYKAYGKDLKIEKGRLIFVGLIDDPGLDVSAVRQIKDVRAGVLVAGTLKSHEISVFSVPSMDQSNALSYLLFGRPMSGLTGSEGGQLYNTAASAGLSGGGLIAKKIGAAFGLEDVEIAKGETLEESALAIGKYLSPKLYVNYGIGLFEPINTFRMRYSLTSRWLLQTEYGIESGGDIIYKIEH